MSESAFSKLIDIKEIDEEASEEGGDDGVKAKTFKGTGEAVVARL